MDDDLKIIFDKRVNKTELCWLWTGKKQSKGYGSFRKMVAHRWAFFFAYGRLDKDKVICHRCDNRLCVRPDHLFEGTQSDNARDAYYKGRMPQATWNTFKLGNVQGRKTGIVPKETVLEIRKLYSEGVKQSILCKNYGLKSNLVSRIVRNKTYTYL